MDVLASCRAVATRDYGPACATGPFAMNGAPPVPLPERFVMHLKADQTLKPDTRQALATLIEMAYASAEEGTLPDESEG